MWLLNWDTVRPAVSFHSTLQTGVCQSVQLMAIMIICLLSSVTFPPYNCQKKKTPNPKRLHTKGLQTTTQGPAGALGLFSFFSSFVVSTVRVWAWLLSPGSWLISTPAVPTDTFHITSTEVPPDVPYTTPVDHHTFRSPPPVNAEEPMKLGASKLNTSTLLKLAWVLTMAKTDCPEKLIGDSEYRTTLSSTTTPQPEPHDPTLVPSEHHYLPQHWPHDCAVDHFLWWPPSWRPPVQPIVPNTFMTPCCGSHLPIFIHFGIRSGLFFVEKEQTLHSCSDYRGLTCISSKPIFLCTPSLCHVSFCVRMCSKLSLSELTIQPCCWRWLDCGSSDCMSKYYPCPSHLSSMYLPLSQAGLARPTDTDLRKSSHTVLICPRSRLWGRRPVALHRRHSR